MTKKQMKSYSELILIKSFDDRFRYLKLNGHVGEDTFGIKRWLNQVFYKSEDWIRFRRDIIIRDGGCDLGVEGYELNYGIQIHHIEPINEQDILSRNVDKLLNPDNVICTSPSTHKAIHYGDETILFVQNGERKPNDTIPWR